MKVLGNVKVQLIIMFFLFRRKKTRGKIFLVAASELGEANEPKKTSQLYN